MFARYITEVLSKTSTIVHKRLADFVVVILGGFGRPIAEVVALGGPKAVQYFLKVRGFFQTSKFLTDKSSCSLQMM